MEILAFELDGQLLEFPRRIGDGCSFHYWQKRFVPVMNLLFRAQSFTSLKADLRQDINGGFAFSIGALMEHFLVGSVLLRLW